MQIFLYDLCVALGYSHPDYLLEDLSGRQLQGWMDYARQVGMGPRRDDIHFGTLTALLHNLWRSKDTPAAKPSQYMPYHQEAELTEEQFQAQWHSAISIATGIADARAKKPQ